ncbi:hypothetical protein ACWDQO_26380 [Streptomyces sp. NPDC003703]|uniref:hypothetical protein n=1 Tax=Streptomyces sp. NPDC003283 TaxID=3364681 RepID=UPI0036CE401C
MLTTVMVAVSALPESATALADTRSVHSAPALGAKAIRNDGRSKSGGSLVTRLKGVPETFEAGGDWAEFDLTLSNVSDEAISQFIVGVQAVTIAPDPALQPSHMNAQMMLGGSWTDLSLEDMGGLDVNIPLPFDDVVLPPGTTVFRMRMKFTSDAPLVRFCLGPQPDEDHATGDEDYWECQKIVRPAAPDPEPSSDPEPSEHPGPEPSADPEPSVDPSPSTSPAPGSSGEPTPSLDPGTGSGSGAGNSDGTGTGSSAGGGDHTGAASVDADGASDPDGVLAHTGSDAATRWALGAGGILVAAGATLAAVGQRRRRRRTTSVSH